MLKMLWPPLIVTFFVNFAFAEAFHCQGSGKFKNLRKGRINLNWELNSQEVLLDRDNLTVQVNIDKSNSDQSHFFSIEVIEKDSLGLPIIRVAKGTIDGMVLYAENSSTIVCLPQ